MFHGLVSGAVPVPGLRFASVMEDIEALNRRALALPGAGAPLPITKLSVHVFGLLTGRYGALDSGAALGRGCGPLVVQRRGAGLGSLAALAGRRVAIPGSLTTAHLLLRIFAPPGALSPETVVPMRFDEIMPAVADGRCDAGVIIHESRFTYPSFGLELLADLGALWERDTGLPLPLGIIAASRDLSSETTHRVEDGLRRSIEHAWANPSAPAEMIRAHAQEMDPEVCRQHIALYVNEHSSSLGAEGRAAIVELLRRGREVGLLPADAPSPWRA
ncbi:MAG: 1,4-dihydroxy-6-naphthoate synthase [Myxococcales bacterium]|nr:1,4-dihydroxy-6-naphthoate synthase [Myxococcales bacterium]